MVDRRLGKSGQIWIIHTDTMPFFKDLRRRKIDAKTDNNLKSSNNSDRSTATVSTTKSSSTLNSLHGSSTPPSSIQLNASNPNLLNDKQNSALPVPPQRPVALSPSSNRNSVLVCNIDRLKDVPNMCVTFETQTKNVIQAMSAPSLNGASTAKLPTSAFAPRIMSISDNSWVRLLGASVEEDTYQQPRYIKKYSWCTGR